jgi:hypothetical protein
MYTLKISLVLIVVTLVVIYRWRIIMARQRNGACPSFTTNAGGKCRVSMASASDKHIVAEGLAAVALESIPKCDPNCDPRHAAGLTDSGESFCLKCGAPVKNS